MSGFKAILT